MRLLEEQAWVWMGYVRLVTELVKDRLLGCMGQVLQQGVHRIGEVGDRASEGQAAGVYGTGFTAGCG